MSVNAPINNLGSLAPNFNLLSVNGNFYNLHNLKGKKGTVIAFICNHCPYVINIIERLVFESHELNKIGISTIGIMSNDVDTYPDDSYEKMKIFSQKYKFNFQYLYDSSQDVAKKYNAVCTPDIYGFNKNLILNYRGRIDSQTMTNNKKPIKRELFYAMESISKNKELTKQQFNSFGCSIKWKIK